jgi:hypothetical protein
MLYTQVVQVAQTQMRQETLVAEVVEVPQVQMVLVEMVVLVMRPQPAAEEVAAQMVEQMLLLHQDQT